jgi:glutamine synthetase
MTKDGVNQVLDGGALSATARRAIAGLMTLAPSITAFGNANPSSYLRLVPHQEAPTSVCWGDRNRSVLVRVPLGWTSGRDMSSQVNPLEKPVNGIPAGKQTFEMRSPDASADVYLLLAALAVACRHGLEMDGALEIAEKTYVDVNIHKSENKAKLAALDHLPDSCAASAARLREQRGVYEQYGVFSPAAIDGIIRMLEAYNDAGLRAELEKQPEKMRELVNRYFYCG